MRRAQDAIEEIQHFDGLTYEWVLEGDTERASCGRLATTSGVANPIWTSRPLRRSLADCGTRVDVRRVEGWGRFTGEMNELLELNRLLLDDLDPTTGIRDIEPHDARIVGRVAIHPSARISSSLIRGPAVIGRDATITDAFIGPYTAIGDGARVEGTEIEHSIGFSGAEVLFVGARLESSVVGRDARIVRDFSPPQALRLQLGDRASVVLR